MMSGDCSYMIDTATVFFDYIRISGWFHSISDDLASIELSGTFVSGIPGSIGLAHPGVEASLGPNRGFLIQSLVEPAKRKHLEILFHTKSGKTIKARVLALCTERKKQFKGRPLFRQFIDIATSDKKLAVLDIGGRARSGVDRREMFKKADYTVLDILPGENVDVVGDAHSLSRLFPPESFDAVFSVSVFEHLLMPWVVAREIGKVLKTGGHAYISTHQTIGMHDQPWDFWRFSDTSWEALFNRQTGFEIIGRAVDNPQYITPHFWSPEQGDDLENATGFLGSNVLARKIGNAEQDWQPEEVSSLLASGYPEREEPLPVWARKSRLKFWRKS